MRQEQAETYGDELWQANPDLCCKLRKVDPMAATMRRTDIWISSIRRSQSPSRAGIELLEWDDRFEVLKLSPLAFWERDEIWTYVRDEFSDRTDPQERQLVR